jgi:catechol 2,3-dioxygenase-like lactoylglutathione lyase family enzyme
VPVTAGFNHVATMTTDLDRLIAFYEAAFAAEKTFEMAQEGDHPRMAVLDLGGGACLNAFEVPDGQIIGEQRSIGRRGAIDHFALAVTDRPTLEKVRERIVDAGGHVGDVQRLGTEWSLFFRDVDGMELEVCCTADEA